jgi:hypothetical protein
MRAGCTRVFQEQVLGRRPRSLALPELLAAVRAGPVVHAIQLVGMFHRRDVRLWPLNLAIDSRTPAGKMISSLSVVEMVTLTASRRVSGKHYCQALTPGNLGVKRLNTVFSKCLIKSQYEA